MEKRIEYNEKNIEGNHLSIKAYESSGSIEKQIILPRPHN